MVKNPPANAGDTRDTLQSRGREDPLEVDMATHSSILAWKIPRTEEPAVTKSRTQLSMRVCVCVCVHTCIIFFLRFFSIWFITGY